jgi:hypothetical protein
MDALTLPDANQLYVVVGARTATSRLLDMAAHLALGGPLLLLDCGNRANPLPLVRELRRLTNDPVQALGNIRAARAFTCYQTSALLEQLGLFPIQQPVLVLDLLAGFYDESISYAEGRRLLEQSLGCMTNICRYGPLLVSARPPPADFPERKTFLEMLCRAADQVWIEETPRAQAPQQLSFFS